MKIALVSIGARRGREKRVSEDLLADGYLKRAQQYIDAEGLWVDTETAFWRVVGGVPGRAAAKVILMDSRGRELSSAEFAGVVGDMRDRGAQQVVVGIGGADGWSAEGRTRAEVLVSMGRMTLPHGLARVVAAEQIYRAMTILAGHPYHCGH